MVEEPLYKVTVVSMFGAFSRTQMDEKSTKVAVYPNGSVIWGYDMLTSGEGIDHVRVSPIGKKPEWIRVAEKDGSRILVSVTAIGHPDTNGVFALAESIRELARAIAKTGRSL